MSPNTICYHNLLSDDLPTMEDRLIKAESCDDETEYNLMVLVSRIALNLCKLATFRQTELTPLPPRVQRHRRLRDQRLNRLAARHCQEVLFKESLARSSPVPALGRSDCQPVLLESVLHLLASGNRADCVDQKLSPAAEAGQDHWSDRWHFHGRVAEVSEANDSCRSPTETLNQAVILSWHRIRWKAQALNSGAMVGHLFSCSEAGLKSSWRTIERRQIMGTPGSPICEGDAFAIVRLRASSHQAHVRAATRGT
jgi:hypothetical protein